MKSHKPVNIAVCGSNAAGLPATYFRQAFLIGQAIAKSGSVLFTGVTTGFSYEAVKGAFKAKGKIIGVSGAESKAEHQERYEQVDLNLWDHIIYTGVGYKMRDVIMIRSVDAAIYIGGGVGTLVEMAAAPDQKVVMGILEGSGGATELIDFIQQISHRNKPVVVKSSDPETLVKKVTKRVKKKN
jgi:hypothetical protein